MTNYGRLAICSSFLALPLSSFQSRGRTSRSVGVRSISLCDRRAGSRRTRNRQRGGAQRPQPGRQWNLGRHVSQPGDVVQRSSNSPTASPIESRLPRISILRSQRRWLQYASYKYRLRGRLFDEDVCRSISGWYVELEWHQTPQFDTDQTRTRTPPHHREGPGTLLDPCQSNI